jgi:gag-polyprotein putative aspartyl protease
MMLIEANINGHPATLLFDTGARRTLLSARGLGGNLHMPPMAHQSYERGLEGQIIEMRVNILLADQKIAADVMVGNLDKLAATMGVDRCDGLLGQDVLEHFRSFTVSRKSHTIDFER